MSGTGRSGRGRWVWAAATLLAAWALAPVDAIAAPKVDTVQLKNGDRLTCEIKKLTQGRLTINTDALERVTVFWMDVAAVTSPREFEVTLASGEKYYGSLGAAAAAGDVTVTAHPMLVERVRIDDITMIVPIGSSLWSRIDGNVDVGLSIAQANKETHWTVNAGGTYRSREWRLSTSLASALTVREDAERTLRNTLTLNGSRLYDNQWFATALGQIQQNDELQLDLRAVGGGGLGKAFSQTNHRLIAGYAGLVYTNEHFVDQPVANSAEIALGGQVDFFTAAKQEFALTNSVVTYYAVTGRSRARLELQSAWRHEFLNDFYWSLNALESFDSNPPDQQKKNDFSVSVAIGWSF